MHCSYERLRVNNKIVLLRYSGTKLEFSASKLGLHVAMKRNPGKAAQYRVFNTHQSYFEDGSIITLKGRQRTAQWLLEKAIEMGNGNAVEEIIFLFPNLKI